MDIQFAYKLLRNKLQLDEDTTQDVMMHLWTNYSKYDATKGAFSSWVMTVASNYTKSKFRSLKYKNINKTKNIEDYDHEREDGSITNYIESKMTSDELSPLDAIILKETEESLLERIKMLPNILRKTMEDVMSGSYNKQCNVQRTRLSRARTMLLNDDKLKKYVLENEKTSEIKIFNNQYEIAEHLDISAQLVSYAIKNEKKIKKIYKISIKN